MGWDGGGGNYKQRDYYPRFWRATVVHPVVGDVGKLPLIIQVKCQVCDVHG